MTTRSNPAELSGESASFDFWRRSTLAPLGILLVLALGLRVGYLLLALSRLGLDQFWAIAPDTYTYWSVASEFFGDDPRGAYSLFRVGPGYGFILAILRLAFGDGRLASILFSVLMGALTPLIVYLLAMELFGKRVIGLMAGAICAVSVTSISLSCHILTDQTFFTIFGLACWCFLVGFRCRGYRWFVWAGLLTGLAALVRPSGALWPFFLLAIPMIIPLPRSYSTRKDFLKHALLAGLVGLIIVQSWSVRNYLATGVFTFGSNGIVTMRDCVVTQINSNNNGPKIVALRYQWPREDGDLGLDLGGAYRRAQTRVWESVKAHPDQWLKYYWRNVESNIRAPNYFMRGELPIGQTAVAAYEKAMLRWLGWVILVLVLAGLIRLTVERRWLALAMLGSIYAYFTLIMGFSYWQGSRLHYPAELAASIVVAYIVEQLNSWFRRWSGRRLSA